MTIGRFKVEVEEKGLANVKFFIRCNRIPLARLIDEINQFEDTVAAGDVKEITSLDGHCPKLRFDAPFV
jgi:hypothetical protein